MDGMNYDGRSFSSLPDIQAGDRAAFRTALLMSIVFATLVVSGGILLAETGLSFPVVEEFPTMSASD